jgi:hypothetical protein
VSPAFRHVYRWDLDKTYLDTDFESVRRLIGIAFEKPEQKADLPGAAALLRELSAERPGEAPAKVAIVSGSPTQMRKTLEKKLQIDGIAWHEFHLKPQWANLRRGRLRAVREQLGYKLPLLLESRAQLAPPVQETLFGDDAEIDALIYAFYGELVAGRADDGQLVALLKAAGAYGDAIDACRAALKRIEPGEHVRRVFIRLDKRTPPGRFAALGSRVVPVFNWFQAALVLFSTGDLQADGVIRVTRAFLSRDRHPPDALANMFQDVLRRGHLPGSAMEALGIAVQEQVGAISEAEVIWKCVQRFADLGGPRRFAQPTPPAQPDWPAILAGLKER